METVALTTDLENRNCGSCTLCCKLLETHDIPSSIGTYCTHCEPNSGCKIYSRRPKECSIYLCMYAQMKHAGIELRPDNCSIIFDKIAEDVISARLERRSKINNLVNNQIKAFRREGFSVVVFRGKECKYFLNERHTKSYVRSKVNDSSKLH